MSWAKEKIDYKNYEKPTDFLKFRDGVTTIRILSEGYIVKKHQYKAQGKFISYSCKGNNCDQCKAKIPLKIRYVWIVLDRDAKKVKVLETGTRLGDQIAKLGRTSDLTTVDIKVTRKGTGLSTTYFAIKDPLVNNLTQEEVKLKDEFYPIFKEQYLND